MSDTRVPFPAAEGTEIGRAAPKRFLELWIATGMDVLRQQAWLIAIMLGYIALGIAIGRWNGQLIKLTLYSGIMGWLYLFFAIVAVTARGASILHEHKPARPVSFLAADFKAFYLAPHRLMAPLPVLVLTPSFLSVVSSIKRLIPEINPFKWDRDFSELDRFLFGGVHPWELLQPYLGTPFVTGLISEFYSYPWLIVVALMQFWLTFTSNPDRQRLLLTTVLAWILLGNVAAIAFSSAGPVYYEHFVAGANPYQDLMAHLAAVNKVAAIGAVDTQNYLWSMYVTGDLRPGSGISAMPSMHLSMGTLLVLAARGLDRRLMVLALAYLAFLEIGSIHLGWHYAIDGYAGIAGTLAIWWALGRLLPCNGPSHGQGAAR